MESLLGKIVKCNGVTGKVVIHNVDEVGREVVRVSPISDKQFPTDFFVMDVEVFNAKETYSVM